jgi:hypothetical protein
MREIKCNKLFTAPGKLYYSQWAEHAVQQTLPQSNADSYIRKNKSEHYLSYAENYVIPGLSNIL